MNKLMIESKVDSTGSAAIASASTGWTLDASVLNHRYKDAQEFMEAEKAARDAVAQKYWQQFKTRLEDALKSIPHSKQVLVRCEKLNAEQETAAIAQLKASGWIAYRTQDWLGRNCIAIKTFSLH